MKKYTYNQVIKEKSPIMFKVENKVKKTSRLIVGQNFSPIAIKRAIFKFVHDEYYIWIKSSSECIMAHVIIIFSDKHLYYEKQVKHRKFTFQPLA